MKQLAIAVLLLFAGVLLAVATVLKVLLLQISPYADREPTVPRDTDPEAPRLTEAQCAALPGGHATVTIRRLGMILRVCPRCRWGARERVDMRDFDARR